MEEEEEEGEEGGQARVMGDAVDVVICGLKSHQIPPAGRYSSFPNTILTYKYCTVCSVSQSG